MCPGPMPVPTAILHARGSSHGKYRNKKEPLVIVSIPVSASYLTEKENAVYYDLAQQLLAVNVITVLDGPLLSRYVRTMFHYIEAQKDIDSNGMIFEVYDKVGNLIRKPNPSMKIANELNAHLFKMEQSLGMSPSARSRIQMNTDTKNEDDGEDLFA